MNIHKLETKIFYFVSTKKRNKIFYVYRNRKQKIFFISIQR